MKIRATITTITDVNGIPEAAEAYNKMKAVVESLEESTGLKFELDMRETREVIRRRRGE